MAKHLSAFARAITGACTLAAVAFAATPASASLTVFKTYTGTVGLSTGGFGSTTDAGMITVHAPVGATVLGAYLYSSTYFGGSASGTLNGSAVTYGAALGSTGGCCDLQAFRADVTSIVSSVINGGVGGAYNFSLTETGVNMDGEALVLVYSDPTLGTSTIGILDGFSATTGDSSSINFADPLDPSDPGFFAEMRIGDGFSCCDQESTITVNGQTLTTVAGNADDSADGGASNGDLITVGDDNDPFTVASPGSPAMDYLTDHERYDLVPYISSGDTQIKIATLNPSNDDNIFLETFHVAGFASVSTGVPEPASWALMVGGFGLIGSALRSRRSRTVTFA